MSAPAPGRVPPSDLDAEAAVLSAALLDPDSLLVASEILGPEHFYADANRRIYEAALALQATGKPVDYVSVAGWLRDAGRLDQIGGTPYIAMLSDCVPSVANVAPHAKRIREKYRLRQLIALCQRVEATGYGPDVGDVQAFIEATESQMYAISQDSVRTETGARVKDILTGCIADLHRKRRGEIPSGKLTPYKGLNRLIAGLKRGTVTTVAARPGMGKTSFVTELLVQGASDNSEATGGVMFSLEMPKDQIGNKLMAQWSLVDTRSIDTGVISGPDLVKVMDSANAIRQMPIIIDDKASITVTEIRSALRRHQRSLFPVRLGIVAIDYLQLMGFGDLPRGMNTNDQLEHVMRGLCAVAKDFDVPIVLLSQLNREVEKRADKRPNLGDLRSSGAIEQDSFNVIFLYREDQYRKPGDTKDNKGELIVAKARAGRSGTVNVEFIPKATKYVDTQEPADEHDEWGASFDYQQQQSHEPPDDWRER